MIECDAADHGAQTLDKCHAEAGFVTEIGFAPRQNPIDARDGANAWWAVYLCATHAVILPVDLYLAGRLPIAWRQREPRR